MFVEKMLKYFPTDIIKGRTKVERRFVVNIPPTPSI